MSLQDISIPNLLGGVSQQPENLRFRNQARESINAYPSLVEGLIKRRPTQFMTGLGSDEANCKMHLVDRSPTERYAIYMKDDTLRVYDLIDGEFATVVNADGVAIQASDLAYTSDADFLNDIECLSVADYTFILNRSTTTELLPTLTPSYDREALLTIITAANAGNYQVRLNGIAYTFTASASDTPATVAEGLADAIITGATSGGGVRLELTGTVPSGTTKTRTYSINATNASTGTFKVKINSLAASSGSHPYGLTYDAVYDQNRYRWWEEITNKFTSANIDYNATQADLEDIAETLEVALNANGSWKGGRVGVGEEQVHTVTVTNPGGNDTINDGDMFFVITSTNDNKEFGPAIKEFAVTDNRTVKNEGSDFSINVEESTLHIRQNDGENFNIAISDEYNLTRMSLVKDEVQSFTDLPTVAPDGFRTKVAGAADEAADDYYVVFAATDPGSMSTGVWKESVGSGLLHKLNPSTMPHILVNDIDDDEGTVTGVANKPFFTYRQFSWDDRDAGDDETNPPPSFIGEQIKAVVYHRGRLGLFSGESVCLSEVNEPSNFWRVSVVDLLDSDRIDITAATDKVSLFKSALSNRKDCVVFSNQTQFRIDSGGDLLTPATAALMHVSSYKANADIRPVSVGDLMFFGFDRVDYSGLSQLVNQSTGSEPYYIADEVSEQAPKYIKGKVTHIAASELEKLVACKADGDRYLYMYKFSDINRERVQSAWLKFDFGEGDTIRDFSFIDSTMYLLIDRGGTLSLERMQLQDGVLDAGETFMYRLDSRVTEADVTMVYDAQTDKTKVTPGFLISGELQVMTRTAAGQVAGRVIPATYGVDGDHFFLVGDQTGLKFYAGFKYTKQHSLGAVYLSGGTSTGNSAIISGRVQVRYIDLLYDDSLHFSVEVTPKYRDTMVSRFTGFNVEST